VHRHQDRLGPREGPPRNDDLGDVRRQRRSHGRHRYRFELTEREGARACPRPLPHPIRENTCEDLMRRQTRRAAVLAFVAATAATALSAAPAQAANILQDPGFENGSVSPWT